MNVLTTLRERGHKVELLDDDHVLIEPPPPPAWVPRLVKIKPELIEALKAEQQARRDGWHQTPGGYWEEWRGGRCVAIQTFHPTTGERCEHTPPTRDPAAERQGRARIERLAREFGGDADQLLEWFADDLEALARLRWEEARGVVAEALSDFLHDNDER